MKTFEVTITIEAADSETVKDVRKSVEENSSLLEFDLLEGNVTDIAVSELKFK
jgi:hypothetical protein